MESPVDIDALAIKLMRLKEQQRRFFANQIEFRINLQLLSDAQEQRFVQNQEVRAIREYIFDRCKNPSGNTLRNSPM